VACLRRLRWRLSVVGIESHLGRVRISCRRRSREWTEHVVDHGDPPTGRDDEDDATLAASWGDQP